MNKHTTARRGKRVHVVLNDGSSFVDKFLEKRSKYYLFEENGKVPVSSIRSFSINKNKFSV